MKIVGPPQAVDATHGAHEGDHSSGLTRGCLPSGEIKLSLPPPRDPRRRATIAAVKTGTLSFRMVAACRAPTGLSQRLLWRPSMNAIQFPSGDHVGAS
jgi:hypothetical protein